MIITCTKGGLLPDFNKCIPYGEHDIAMYISDNIYFVFYDILDCKTQSRFSLSTFLDIDKEAHISKEEMDFRLDYFRRHSEALISKSLINPNSTIFFNSIEAEVLSKYFYDMKFTCKVDIFVNNKQVELEDVLDDKENYERIIEFVNFFNMCEYVNAKEYTEIKKGVFIPKGNKKKSFIKSFVIGGIGFIAGVSIGYKLSSRKDGNKASVELTEEEA